MLFKIKFLLRMYKFNIGFNVETKCVKILKKNIESIEKLYDFLSTLMSLVSIIYEVKIFYLLFKHKSYKVVP